MKRNKIPYDDYHNRIPPPTKRDVIGTVRAMFGDNALRASWKIIEIDEQ